MKLTVQRRLAAQLLKCGPSRISFDNNALTDIKEAITKADIRSLIRGGAISRKPTASTSRTRAQKIKEQKKKGRRRGVGTRKGKSTARYAPKKSWMDKVRSQRRLLRSLKEKKLVDGKGYRELYHKVKGGFFRNQRHIKLYVQEHGMIKK